MNTRLKYLQKLCDENTFVDIYTDYYNESVFGYIRKFNDEFLLQEKINESGKVDGIIVYKQKDITHIRWGNKEIENTHKLSLNEKFSTSTDKIEIDTIENILKTVNCEFGYVTLHIQDIDNDMCIIGEIEDFDNETIVIHEFGTLKTNDRGKLIFSIDEITRIEAGGIYETNLLKIYKE